MTRIRWRQFLSVGRAIYYAPSPSSKDLNATESNVLATFAQFERRLIGQRTREALAVKREQGVRLGRPPTIDPKLAARVRRMRARGATFREIAEQLNDEGVPTPRGGREWRPSSLQRVLR